MVREQPHVTKQRKNIFLEILRGIAATLVVLNHIVGKTPYFIENKNFFTSFIGSWGTEAVLIFFVLSGIVIAISFEASPKTPFQFIYNRFIRIWPIMFISIVLSIAVEGLFMDTTTSSNQIIGNLFFLGTLQGYIVPALKTNPVLWSLAYEMLFYIVFSFCIGKNLRLKMKIWLIVAFSSGIIYFQFIPTPFFIVNHFLTILAYSFIWLLGYFAYHYNAYFAINKNTALLFTAMLPMAARLHVSDNYYDIITHSVFGITSLPLFFYLLAIDKKKPINKYSPNNFVMGWYIILLVIFYVNSESLLKNKILYIALPIFTWGFLAILQRLKVKVPNYIKQPALKSWVFVGGISYAIYCIHFPLLIAYNKIFNNHSLIFLPLYLSLTILLSFWIERKLQPKINFNSRLLTQKISSIYKLVISKNMPQ